MKAFVSRYKVFLIVLVPFALVLVFLGAWSTTKIPLILFELSSLGPAFALTRLSMNIPVILVIAAVSSALLKDEEKIALYDSAQGL